MKPTKPPPDRRPARATPEKESASIKVSSMRGPKWLPEAVVATIGVLSMLFVLLLLPYAVNIKDSYHDATIAIKELRLHMANAHLWLEEAIQGDDSVNVGFDVFGAIDDSIAIARALRLGGAFNAASFSAEQDATASTRLRGIEESLLQLRDLSERRWADRDNSKSGSAIDQTYDAQYANLQSLAARHNEFLSNRMKGQDRRLSEITQLIAMLLLLAICSVGWLTWQARQRAARRHLKLEALIASRTEALTREISDRRADAAALACSEERLRAFSEASQEGVLLHDGTSIVDVNPAFARMYGYQIHEVVGQPITFGAVPESVRTIGNAVASGGVSHYQIVGRRKDGSTFPLDIHSLPVHYQGRPMRIACLRDMTEHRQAEMQRDRFFDLALDTLCIMETGGRFKRVNPAFCQTTGYSAEELLAGPILDLVHRDDRRTMKAALDSIAEGGTAESLEVRMHHCDGSWMWLSWNCRSFPREGLIYASARDVTATRVADAALRSSEEFSRSVVESSQDCLKVLSLDGKIEYMPPTGCKLMEVDDFCAIQNADWLSFWTDARQAAAEALATARAGGCGRFTGFCRTFKGTPKWWEVVLTPIRGGDGEIRQLLSVSRDITATREDGLALARFKNTLDQTLDAVFMFDPDTLRLTYVNQGGIAHTGYSQPELLRMTPLDFDSVINVERFRGMIEPLLAGEQSSMKFESMHRHRDGRETPVETVLQLVRQDDEPPRFVSMVRDITERRRNERALHEANTSLISANRSKDDFLAAMSHEIRTPLNGLLGMLELLALSDVGKTNFETLQTAQQSGRRLLQIVSDILDYSKLEAGNLKLLSVPTAISEIVAQAAEKNSELLNAKGLTAKVHTDPAIWSRVMVDPSRLTQILDNFICNAIKFTDRGQIEVGARLLSQETSTQTVNIYVKDTGIGISAEKQSQLFGKASGSGLDAARLYGGTGLGLSICRRLAELMGGTVDVQSTLGEGTEIGITLEVASARRTAAVGA